MLTRLTVPTGYRWSACFSTLPDQILIHLQCAHSLVGGVPALKAKVPPPPLLQPQSLPGPEQVQCVGFPGGQSWNVIYYQLRIHSILKMTYLGRFGVY